MNASQINWERVWGPWLGLLGAVFLFVGISAPDQKFGNIPMAHIADGVGVAAFLFSMSNIIERLKKGQETSSMQSRKDTLTLLEENRELNRRLSEALAASNGALMELLERDLSATRRVWDCTSSLYDLTETTFKLRTQESYVVRVSGTMIENVVRRCTSKLARDIRTVLEGSEFSLEIRDFSPVTEYLEALVAALPENSCWLGLSRLTLPGAWEADLSSRAEWNSTLLAKASDKKVVVCRVWILDSASDIRLIENEMRQQSEKGVVARYYVAGPGDDLRNTQDPQAHAPAAHVPDLDPRRHGRRDVPCRVRYESGRGASRRRLSADAGPGIRRQQRHLSHQHAYRHPRPDAREPAGVQPDLGKSRQPAAAGNCALSI